jgi:hypothetical protein
MPIVSVTRLRMASLWSMPGFLYYSLLAARQAQRTAGFRGGWLGNEGVRSYWTSTMWDSVEAMRAFRNSGTHLKAMPKLLRWCDEASYTHWEQPEADLPTGDVAHERLLRDGKLSKVLKPSPQHASGRAAASVKPRPNQRLAPRPADAAR